MKSLMTGLVLLFMGFRRGLRDPEFRAIGFLLLVAVIIGTFVFRAGRGSTRPIQRGVADDGGHANLAPTMAVTKIFSMVLSLVGIGLMLAFLSRLTTFREESKGGLRLAAMFGFRICVIEGGPRPC